MARNIRRQIAEMEEIVMSLLDEAMNECVLMNKTTASDGYGGRVDAWAESDFTFSAAIVYNTSVQARVAEQQGIKNMYTVTTSKLVKLNFNEIFKRKSDGKLFRVTSDGEDNKTPYTATLDMRQYTAEEYVMPNG